MPVLVLDNLAMSFGPRVLFRQVCAEIGPAEALVVTGANGCGKSTLLKIAAGLLRPEAGRVQRSEAFGYAAPDVNLYSELTGHENLTFFARIQGLAVDIPALLSRVGLPRRAGQDLVANYSTGMRHRLKLAASLIGDPELLIWDEPTMSLDEAGAACVEGVLTSHRQQGRLALIATNDPSEADRWSRAGATLHLGRA